MTDSGIILEPAHCTPKWPAATKTTPAGHPRKGVPRFKEHTHAT